MREREIVRQLQDPDLDVGVQTGLEIEFQALKMSDWFRSPVSWEGGWNLDVQARLTQGNPLTLQDALVAQRRGVVLGAPGSGKSTLLRWLVLMCVRARLHPEETNSLTATTDDVRPLPVLLSLAAFANALQSQPSLTLWEFIAAHLKSLGIEHLEPLFLSEFAKGACWILLDGVDEVAGADVRARVVKAIESFLAGTGDNRCLLTSRLHGYERVAGLPHFHLRAMDANQGKQFIFAWNLVLELELNPSQPDADRALVNGSSLIKQIERNKHLSTLAANPLLLVALLLIHRQNQTLPQSRVEIYHVMTQTLLDTWNKWRSESRYNTGGEVLTAAQLRQVLGKVALWSRREKPGGILRRRELERQFVAACRELPVQQGDVEQTAQSYLNAAVEQAGLLEERAPGIFAFWHPTFEEFLAASELTNPLEQAASKLLPLRADPFWREVILLSIGLVGIINDDRDAASDLVRALARTDLPVIEPILHPALRLGVACIAENPTLSRDLIQELLLELTQVLTVQPYEPMAGDFISVTDALPAFKPNQALVEALGDLAALHHSLGTIRAAVFRLLANVAATNERARELCQQQFDAELDPEYPQKGVMSRFHAIIGLIRAEQMLPRYLMELVWHNRPINFVEESVQLLGIGAESDDNPTKQRLIEKIQPILVSPVETKSSAARLSREDARVMLGPLSAALMLLYASRDSEDIFNVVEEALKPKYDLCGGVFDAAQVPVLFNFDNEEKLVKFLRLSLVALRRWLKHSQVQRRIYSAEAVLNHIERWEKQFAPIFENLPEFAGRTEEAKNEKFFEVHQVERHLLRQEAIKCLVSCLNERDLDARLLAADFLLQKEHLKIVARAIEKWMKSPLKDGFNPFSTLQLVSELSKTPEGQAIVLGWMRGEHEWLKAVSSATLLFQPQHREEAFRVMMSCLSSPLDEVRSSMGAMLALFVFIEGRPLPPEVETALRSCLGSDQGNARRTAASILYQSGFREEGLLQYLVGYIYSQQVGERFDTLRAFQEHDAELAILGPLVAKVGMQNQTARAAFEKVQQGQTLNHEDVSALQLFIQRQPGEDHETYFHRRCFYDWLWFNLEAKNQMRNAV